MQKQQLRNGDSVPRRTDLNLAEVLDGGLGADGVGDLVHHPMQHGLASLLNQCLPGREQLTTTTLLRTKFKPGRKLTAYYRLQVGAEVRPIALSWFAELPADSVGSAELQDRGASRQLVAPFAHLSARTEGGLIALLIAPIDPQMPQLMRLSDHSYVTGLLATLHADSALRSEARRTQAVRYRPGQRHVLRVSAGAGPDQQAAYLKIDRDDHGARAVRFARAVGPLLAERSPGARLVEPLGYGAEDQVAVWRGLAGTAMSEEIRDPSRASRLLASIGEAVRVLHDIGEQTADNALTADQRSAPHSARSELPSVLGAGQYLSVLLPEVAVRYRVLAMEVLERLEDLPSEDPRLGHGDLKCDNILVAENRVHLLDLDRTGLAEPAMDLGKFLADLAWWGHRHGVDVAGPVRDFLEAYGPCDPARLSRARLIAVLYRLKLAARRTPVHDPNWYSQVERQVDEAAVDLRATTP